MNSNLTGSVFVSYASQDGVAAKRIADALRAAGIEVWFDHSELRGGDAWDQMIRRQIRACALFIPVISRHAHERPEGYFRLEWKLAVDRTNLISATRAFLLPVVIDDTHEDDDEVPEKIREVHWTRLPNGETSTIFVDRIKQLLAPERLPAPANGRTTPHGVVSELQTAPRPTRSRIRAIYGLIAAALLLTSGYFGSEKFKQSKPDAVNAMSIAVLPLANEGGEASQQFFADGISEDLITTLSQFSGLKVIGRTSAFQFRDSKDDTRTIGAKLGVAHILEGSVRRSGDVVRVNAALIDTDDGSTQWSERYERPYKDLFGLQDEITGAVARALRAKLIPGENGTEQSERPPSGSLEAYSALLQGRSHLARNTESDVRTAIQFFTRSAELDPNYALAWSELSRGWTTLAVEFLEGASREETDAYRKSHAAVDRALTLSPDLVAAHRARGLLLLYGELDWRGAEADFRRALQLAPNDAEADYCMGILLATRGEIKGAIEVTQRALRTDPLRASYYSRLASYFGALNDLDEAEHMIRKAIELQPAAASFHQTLTIIEIRRGNAGSALAAAQQEAPGIWQDQALGFARQIGNDQRVADSALQTLIERDAANSAYEVAQVYALRKDAEKMFEWLDRAWVIHDPGIQQLLYDPFILRYKADLRLAAFCHKVGLPAPGDTP